VTQATVPLRTIILLAALTALDAMSIDMYIPALPEIRRTFSVSPAAAQNSMPVFLLGMAVGQSVGGPLLDRFGRRLPVLCGAAIFVFGSAVCALAHSYEIFAAGRLAQALGAAMGVVAPRAVIADRCEPREAARIFSMLMQVFMIAPVVAPLAGGYLLTHLGWRAVFWALTIVGSSVFTWALLCFPESLPPAARSSLGPARVVASYGRLLLSLRFLVYACSASLITSSMFAYLSGSAFALIVGYGVSPTMFSLVFAGNSIGLTIAGQLNLRLLRYFEARTVLMGALVGHCLCCAALSLAIASSQVPLAVYLPLLFLALVCLGITFGNITALVMGQSGTNKGTASALLGVMQSAIGAASGVAVGLLSGPGGMIFVMTGCGVLALLLCVAAGRLRPLSAAVSL
jgi:DHA1 family bicyclomycin/chloramphenicol resistance-like MFS transporter